MLKRVLSYFLQSKTLNEPTTTSNPHFFEDFFHKLFGGRSGPLSPAEYYSQIYGGSPKIEGSILKYRVKRRTTFAKAYGTKVRCYGKHVGQHNGNLKGT
jgi:hypothetical protein